jgi:hypothetical protein
VSKPLLLNEEVNKQKQIKKIKKAAAMSNRGTAEINEGDGKRRKRNVKSSL